MATQQGEWSGTVRTEAGDVVVQPMVADEAGEWWWSDALDAPLGWVDIQRVGLGFPSQPHWRIDLADRPPLAAGLDRSEIIGYGFVFETTGDSVADYVVGIDNDAPQPGDFHVWVTNLATGATSEQIGPPYGFPVEFSHPDEMSGASGVTPAPEMVFTFLPGSSPPGVRITTTRFYAWASFTVAGEVMAWDYAPDTAWLTLSD